MSLAAFWSAQVLRPFKLALCSLLLLVAAAGCGGRHYRPARDARPIERVMEVTAYCNCGSCCNWRRRWWMGKPVIASGPQAGRPKAVGITASGSRARHGTVAADTSRYPFGTIVFVPGYGYGRVEDRGGAIRGEKLDLWFSSHQKALEWGRKRVTVQLWLPRGE